MTAAWGIIAGVFAVGFFFGYAWRWTSVADIMAREERRERKQRIRLNAIELQDRGF